MKRTLKQRQELCTDLHEACHEDESGKLLDIIIDEYIYRLNDQELDELEDVMASFSIEENN